MDKHRFMAVCRVINGAATSLGRVPIVLDIYAERDLARVLTLSLKSKNSLMISL